jgi:hypothetical protein
LTATIAGLLASLPAKATAAPRSPPFRHGFNTLSEKGSDHTRPPHADSVRTVCGHPDRFPANRRQRHEASATSGAHQSCLSCSKLRVLGPPKRPNDRKLEGHPRGHSRADLNSNRKIRTPIRSRRLGSKALLLQRQTAHASGDETGSTSRRRSYDDPSTRKIVRDDVSKIFQSPSGRHATSHHVGCDPPWQSEETACLKRFWMLQD